MISMNFNSYASLAIFFITAVLFRFIFDNETIYTMRELAVFDLITVLKLAIQLSVKTLKSGSVHSFLL